MVSLEPPPPLPPTFECYVKVERSLISIQSPVLLSLRHWIWTSFEIFLLNQFKFYNGSK